MAINREHIQLLNREKDGRAELERLVEALLEWEVPPEAFIAVAKQALTATKNYLNVTAELAKLIKLQILPPAKAIKTEDTTYCVIPEKIHQEE